MYMLATLIYLKSDICSTEKDGGCKPMQYIPNLLVVGFWLCYE